MDDHGGRADAAPSDEVACELLCRRSAAQVALGTSASFEAALADGLLALKYSPVFSMGYLRAGVALRSLRRFAEAEKMLRDGLALATDRDPFQAALEELAKST